MKLWDFSISTVSLSAVKISMYILSSLCWQRWFYNHIHSHTSTSRKRESNPEEFLSPCQYYFDLSSVFIPGDAGCLLIWFFRLLHDRSQTAAVGNRSRLLLHLAGSAAFYWIEFITGHHGNNFVEGDREPSGRIITDKQLIGYCCYTGLPAIPGLQNAIVGFSFVSKGYCKTWTDHENKTISSAVFNAYRYLQKLLKKAFYHHLGTTGTRSPSPVVYSSSEFSLDWMTI